ncbi:MAG: caspase family protein [Candidatus Aminicenantales bacterium]|jgi:hypothetical protein
MPRKRVILTAALFIFCLLTMFLTAGAETRRALLIGIDKYDPPPGAKPGPTKAIHGSIKRVAVNGNSKRQPFESLDGAVSDMDGMKILLMDKFGFREGDIKTLTNQEATADEILSAIQKHLIDSAQPGDVSLFYYAGHGSLMRNLSTPKQSGYDSTIVPADWWRGTPDIRDKELARLFRKAVEKGIALTVIADSCHSGSLLRGGLKMREIPGDAGFYVEDPPDRDQAGHSLPNPEEEGALVLSAAQDYQSAAEIATDSGWHGVFTWALLQILRYSPENEPMSRIFERVRALVQSEEPVQEPVMAGKGRAERGLFGQPADLTRSITVAARKVAGSMVELQGGQVLGLAKGCELVRIPGSSGEAPVRIEITDVTGLGKSVAQVRSGPPESVHPGDLFQLDKWVQPEEGILRIYLPPTPPSLARIMAVAKSVAGLQLPGWVEDPTTAPPDFVMGWNGSEWVLARNAPGGEVVLHLGKEPNTAQIRKRIADSPAARFFLMLPPPAEVADQLRLGPGTALDAIVPVSSMAGARYALEGRYRGAGLEFAWIAPTGSEEDFKRMALLPRMPLRTKWLALTAGIDAPRGLAAQVEEYAVRIARLRAWIELEPPQASTPFPYSLAFQETSSKRMVTEGEMKRGERYKLFLKSDPDLLARLEQARQKVPRRYVYVFIIDSDGTGTSLFPGAQGNVENLFPPDRTPLPAEIPLSSRDYDLEISDPLGTDVYFMIVSAEAIDPMAFTFEGVRGGPEGMRGGGLSQLLFGIGSGQKRGGKQPPAPSQWSIEKRVIRSVAK